MFYSDLNFIFQWWFVLFLIGIIFLPLTSLIFSNFFDKGYIFSKILGTVIVSYAIFLFASLGILKFSSNSIFLILLFSMGLNFLVSKSIPSVKKFVKKNFKIFIFEEFIFLLTLFFWSYIKGFQPDIHGLEKYMDFGFVNSILRSDYFPPKDMWFTPFPINYYYFGHLITAVLTKLSDLPSYITFNLMISTLFALTFTEAFSIGLNLFNNIVKKDQIVKKNVSTKFSFLSSLKFSVPIVTGLLSGLLVTLSGNFHTIYTFFKPYQNENPVPPWQLGFSPQTFPNSYWYPNATRFIYNTIHEFPIYSFVVSDLHGHVIDIPIVLLTIAILLSLLLGSKGGNHNFQKSESLNRFNFIQWLFNKWKLLIISFLLAIMYMTNAWDGIIYFIFASIILLYIQFKENGASPVIKNVSENLKSKINKLLSQIFIMGIAFIFFSLPFQIHFKPFVSGIGILCAPKFLTNIGRIGPFLLEANHCQKSPFWQLFILYGFFYFWIVVFLSYLFKIKKRINKNEKEKIKINKSGFGGLYFFRNLRIETRIFLMPTDIFVLILIFLSTLLIIIPEFIYAKDIYPAHYRANTMFKLVYQSFIMLSLSSTYIIIRVVNNFKISNLKKRKYIAIILVSLFGLFLVLIYPFFTINSYYGNLQTYKKLDGTSYIKSLYPSDYLAILWIDQNIKGQPVILEAQGDSYTDYARVSANTGLPTVLGWTVHEWLWRGTYDIPAPRIADVTSLYESRDIDATKSLINKYNISFVFIGSLEKQKYSNLYEEKFKELGSLSYSNSGTKIYKINN